MRRTKTATATIEPMTYEEYLKTPENNEIEELHFGYMVREDPDMRWHQEPAMRLAYLLYADVHDRGLGHVSVAPRSVVLDRERALVLSPDIAVVLPDRYHLMKDGKVMGPPNLVIEVASPSTRRRDRVKKVEWFRTYGVEECWLIDGRTREIERFDFAPNAVVAPQVFRGDEPFRTRILPHFRHATFELFDRKGDVIHARLEAERSSYDKDQT